MQRRRESLICEYDDNIYMGKPTSFRELGSSHTNASGAKFSKPVRTVKLRTPDQRINKVTCKMVGGIDGMGKG